MLLISDKESYGSLEEKKSRGHVKWATFLLSVFFVIFAYTYFNFPHARFSLSVIFFLVAFVFLRRKSSYSQIKRRYRSFRVGLEGENMVVQKLKDILDDRYFYIPNYEWSHLRIGDTDGILIGPKGIFVIEVKRWRGWFRVSGMDIFQSLGNNLYKLYPNVFRQVSRNAAALRHHLLNHGSKAPVIPVVVLVGAHKTIAGKPGIFVAELKDLGSYFDQFSENRLAKIDAFNIIESLKPNFPIYKKS